MVTVIYESDGFSRTMGIVKDLIRQTSLNGWQLTQVQQQLSHVTSNINESEITAVIQ